MLTTKQIKSTSVYKQIVRVLSVRKSMRAMRQFERLVHDDLGGVSPIQHFDTNLSCAVDWSSTIEGHRYWRDVEKASLCKR